MYICYTKNKNDEKNILLEMCGNARINYGNGTRIFLAGLIQLLTKKLR